MWLFESHLNVIGGVPVDVVQHQVGRPDQIKSHPAGFRAQQEQEALRVGAVEAVDQSLPLARGRLTIEPTERVTSMYAQVLKQVQSLSVV